MRIGVLSTRLSGTDGVSLETEKMAHVLERLGHELFFCAGELGGFAQAGHLIPKLHFTHPEIAAITHDAFENPDADAFAVQSEIRAQAQKILPDLARFVKTNQLDFLIVQNALAIPMNLPLGVALTELIADQNIPTIAHHHDFFWERERFERSLIPEMLESHFPPDLPSIQHLTINSLAQTDLFERKGIRSTLLPNVFDFHNPPAGIDDYNRDFRTQLDLDPDSPFILQPTRVIRRKGIELALELLRELKLPQPTLFISHSATDEGLEYWNWLVERARDLGVGLKLIDHLVSETRTKTAAGKTYALWDIYPHADLITFPSLYEGFGNALLEGIYFKKPVVVNCYPVYQADIQPLGFDFVELNGSVEPSAVLKTRELMGDPDRVRAMVEKNYTIALEHFSHETLERKIAPLLGSK